MKLLKWSVGGAIAGGAWWLSSLLFGIVLKVPVMRVLFDLVNRPVLKLLDPVIRSLVPADHIPQVVLLVLLGYAVLGALLGAVFGTLITMIRKSSIGVD